MGAERKEAGGKGKEEKWGGGSRVIGLPNMAAGASLSLQSRKSSTWSSGVQALLLNMDPPIWPMWPMQPMSSMLGTYHTLVLFILLVLNLQVTPWLEAPAAVATLVTLSTGARTKSCHKPPIAPLLRICLADFLEQLCLSRVSLCSSKMAPIACSGWPALILL